MGLQIKNKVNQLIAGFSLIELMVVVAIIGVLASIAVPAYDGYMIRARLTHVTSMADSAKKAISEYRNLNTTFPATLGAVFTAPTDPNVTAVTGPTTAYSATYTFIVTGKGITATTIDPTLGMTATWTSATATAGASLTWACNIFVTGFTAATVPASYIPPGCTVVAAAPTAGGS